MQNGRRVRNTRTGEFGVTVTDMFNVCGPYEIAVAYDGTTTFTGTHIEVLEELGRLENIPDPKKCGAGYGTGCCIFLAMGPGGWRCERYSSLRHELQMRKDKMNAQREPVEPYPECMNQGVLP